MNNAVAVFLAAAGQPKIAFWFQLVVNAGASCQLLQEFTQARFLQVDFLRD